MLPIMSAAIAVVVKNLRIVFLPFASPKMRETYPRRECRPVSYGVAIGLRLAPLVTFKTL